MQAVAEMEKRAAAAAAAHPAPLGQPQFNLLGARSMGRTRRVQVQEQPGVEDSEDTWTETSMETSITLPPELRGLSQEVFFGNECYRTLNYEDHKGILHSF